MARKPESSPAAANVNTGPQQVADTSRSGVHNLLAQKQAEQLHAGILRMVQARQVVWAVDETGKGWEQVRLIGHDPNHPEIVWITHDLTSEVPRHLRRIKLEDFLRWQQMVQRAMARRKKQQEG